MDEFSDDVTAGYNILDLYYKQINEDNEKHKKKYEESKLREKLLILDACLYEIDVTNYYRDQFLFVKQDTYTEALSYLDMEDVNLEMISSFDMHMNLYAVIDIVILKKWEKIKNDLCKYTA